MEARAQEIKSRSDKNIKISVIPGHFATNHSHVNYYIDITSVKTNHKMAMAAADSLAETYQKTDIDTIVCLEGMEVLGAFLAMALSEGGVNSGKTIYVITPEFNSNNQMIFRDNIQKKIWGKKILLLLSSVSTGKTISRSLDCFRYYNGNVAAITAIFSAIEEFKGTGIHALFVPSDLAGYKTATTDSCALCRDGVKVDALVNTYGYSKI
ncbi:MAG: orotate phosphoribosyltransferase [Oscillospiraceae bacterium]